MTKNRRLARDVTDNVLIACEFIIYEKLGSGSPFKRCNEEAKIYMSEKGMNIIKGGKIIREGKKVIRLCDEHYKELKLLVPDLKEVNNE